MKFLLKFKKYILIFGSIVLCSPTLQAEVTISNAPSDVVIGATITDGGGSVNINAGELADYLRTTGSVTITATVGNITVANNITVGANTSRTLTLIADADIIVNANINLAGANGVTPANQPGAPGAQGSNIRLTSTNGNIIVSGQITTSGGNGGNSNLNAREGGTGAAAGTITLSADNGLIEVNSPLIAIGGNGGTGSGQCPGSIGGNGNSISLNASEANINASLNTYGGTGVASGGGANIGGIGGNGGAISVTVTNDLFISGSTTSINSAGGAGSQSGDRNGGNGGNGGVITLTSETGIVEIGNISAISSSGGRGGNTGNNAGGGSYGGKGGNAGALSILSFQDIIIGTITSGITANGAVGGNRTGGSAGGGGGGNGANLSLISIEGEITVGSAINVSAGDKGNGQENNGNDAGAAGKVLIVAKNDIIIDGTIEAKGGNAGVSTQNSSVNNIGEATVGGNVTISSSSESVTIKKTITVNGGDGGSQNVHGRCAAAGADGGSIIIEAKKEINIEAPLTANGGDAAPRSEAGGAGGIACNPGGNGGTIDLSAEDAIKVGANIQANGGKGGESGGNGTDNGGIGGNGGNIFIEGPTSGSGNVSANGGAGGAANSWGGGRCNYGGPSGNMVINGTVTSGNPGNPLLGSGSCPGGATTLCGTPVVNSLLALLTPFCENNTPIADLNIPALDPATDIEWNGGTGTSGMQIESSPGSNSYVTTVPATVSIGDAGRRIRYFATNACGKTGYAYAVITRSCPDFRAEISGNNTICENVITDSLEIIIRFIGGTAPYSATYTDGTNNFTLPNVAGQDTTFKVRPNVSTQYTLVSAKDKGGLGADASPLSGQAEIIVNPAPATPVITTLSDKTLYICLNDNIINLGDLIANNDVVIAGSDLVFYHSDKINRMDITADTTITMETKIFVRSEDINGCLSDFDSIEVKFNSQPKITGIIPNELTECVGNELTTDNLPVPSYDLGSTPIVASEWRIGNPGDIYDDYVLLSLPYTLTLADNGKIIIYYVEDGCGNDYSNELTLIVREAPVISIMERDGKTQIIPGEEINIDVTVIPNDVSLTWQFNGREVTPTFPYQAFEDELKIVVIANDGVCQEALSNEVIIRVDWPNAITPHIIGSPNATFLKNIGYKMHIFNRFGVTIYSGTDGWDGTFENKIVDPGVYYYVIELTDGKTRKATLQVVKE